MRGEILVRLFLRARARVRVRVLSHSLLRFCVD